MGRGSEKGVCELQVSGSLLSCRDPRGEGRGEGGLGKLSLTHRGPPPPRLPHTQRGWDPGWGRAGGSGREQEREHPRRQTKVGSQWWVAGSWLPMWGRGKPWVCHWQRGLGQVPSPAEPQFPPGRQWIWVWNPMIPSSRLLGSGMVFPGPRAWPVTE